MVVFGVQVHAGVGLHIEQRLVGERGLFKPAARLKAGIAVSGVNRCKVQSTSPLT